MGWLLVILGVLFLSLFILVPLVERFGQRSSPEQLQKLTRWIFPLLVLLILMQGIRLLF